MLVKVEGLNESKMKCIFEPLEGSERNGSVVGRSRVVIFADTQGFHDIVLHLEFWLHTSKQKV